MEFDGSISCSLRFSDEGPEDTPHASKMRIEELNPTPELEKGFYVEKEFERFTEIQAMVLPTIVNPPHENVIFQSPIGSGKSTALVMAMLFRVDLKLKFPQAICIVPNSFQKMDLLSKMGKHSPITCVLGLPPYKANYIPLAKMPPVEAQVIIGTPVTIHKWIEAKKLNTRRIKMLVIDDVDPVLAEIQGKEGVPQFQQWTTSRGETLNAMDYAHRAKNIKNKPEMRVPPLHLFTYDHNLLFGEQLLNNNCTVNDYETRRASLQSSLAGFAADIDHLPKVKLSPAVEDWTWTYDLYSHSPSDFMQEFKIYIKTRPGKTISLVARTSDTILGLKLKIPPSEWNHGDLPDLVYNGEYLNDYHTLESYNILQDSFFECRLGPKISVRNMSGKTISVEVASSKTTIGNMKTQIQDKVSGNILPSSRRKLAHLEIAFKDIELATRISTDDCIIRRGGFGQFYSGEIDIFAQRSNVISRHGETEFWEEIGRLSRCRHENLLSLLEFCDKKIESIIVYDYSSHQIRKMRKKSKVSGSELTLNQDMSDPTLTWFQRPKICMDVANSLDYIDPSPRAQIEPRALTAFVEIAYKCLAESRQRPSIGQIVKELEALQLQESKHKYLEMKASRCRNILSRYWRDILPKIEIYITTRPGNTISLVADTSDTIRDLKLKIPPSEWNHRDLPILFYKGEHLNDNRTLDSYNISWFSTLECGLNISVRTMSGKTVSVKVASSNTTIGNLKAKIQDKEGVLQFQQKLFFNGRQLNNKCTLVDYKIEDGSTLLLVCRSKGWIPIYVKNHTGKTISREVKSSDTIGDVKVKIADMVGVPPYNQILFFAGEELLDNDRTLYDYHIHSESTLSLVPVCRGRMKIYAETIDGNTIPLDVISRHTIGEVKSLIQDKEGIPTDTQTLVYAGQELDDSRTLVYYLIQNETTLRLVDNTLMRREPMQIHVEIVATSRTIPLQVQTFDTINSVKSKIQRQEHIPYEQQRLFLPQIQLKDNCTLADYYIQNESTLHLVVTLIKIAVKTPDGKIITLDVDSSDTIWNVKAKIQDVEEIPRDHQKLFLAEEREQLQNSLTLAKCCVKTESTLHLLVTSDKTGV